MNIFLKSLFYLILITASRFSFAEDTNGQWKYEREGNDNFVTITGCGAENACSDLVIPRIISGFLVKYIGNYAFLSKGLTSVTFPQSVISIGDGAFGSNELTSVVLPDSLLSMGTGAFKENQLESVILPCCSLTSIGTQVFGSNEIKQLYIPFGVTSIGFLAFQDNKIEQLTLSDDVTSIGRGAFGSNALEQIIIPNSVTSIGDFAFQDNKIEKITIPNSVTNIGQGAFRDNALVSITLPNALTNISEDTFRSNNLTDLTIADNVSTIGASAFRDNQISSLIIGDSVITIGEYAFIGNQIESLTIGTSIDHIGLCAFRGYWGAISNNNCDFGQNFTSIITANRVNGAGNINRRAFHYYVETDFFNYQVANNVAEITGCKFVCRKNLVIPKDIGGFTIKSIAASAFDREELVNLVLPPEVTHIGDYAFYENLIDGELIIPNSVTSIGQGAFFLNLITNVTIGEGVTSIGQNAFQSENGLVSAQFLGDRPIMVFDTGAVTSNISLDESSLPYITYCTGRLGWPGESLNNGVIAVADCDGDGILDTDDVFPFDSNETLDTDGDGIGNNADTDDDNDAVADSDDAFPNNAMYSEDSDSDGMPDEWETKYGLDPNDPSDATNDQDNDSASALDEFLAGTIPSLSLDIDGNEDYDALTDGLLLLRGMFGLDGSALVTGTIASDATYTESVDIEARIETLGDLVDIDGNGDIDALTDGLLTLRYLFDLQGDTLINGVVADDANRKTAEEIEAHLQTLMPTL